MDTDTVHSDEQGLPAPNDSRPNLTLAEGDVEKKVREVSADNLTPLETNVNPYEVDESIEPPYGWVVVGASFVVQALVVGTVNNFGVYQDHYVKDLYKSHPVSEISLIGTLAVVGMDLFGPFTGPFADHFGYRISALIGTIIMVLSLLATSFAYKLWHLYLAQGLLYGIGGSLAFFTSVTIPSQWFKKRRGLATGITVGGGGIGGLILSPMIAALFDKIGYEWTVRTVALVHLVILVPASALFRCRVESGKDRRKRIKRERAAMTEEERQRQDLVAPLKKDKIVDFSVMRESKFFLLFCSTFFMSLGYFVSFFYFPTYARLNGVSTSTSSVLVGILNGSSAIGRVLMGLASDYIGDVNSLLLSMIFTFISVLVFWILSKSLSVMIVFCIFYGFWSGSFVALIPSVSAHLCGIGRLASVAGIIYGGIAVGTLIGTPTAGAILDKLGHNTNYLPLQLWTGFVMVIATCIAFVLKTSMERRLFAKV
ncbi:hypothetical protein BGZ73_006047 [Actinomortierella ambigua]|nr:hypothetical protein BGZ73_006047 [Actinomortierella ambigua]